MKTDLRRWLVVFLFVSTAQVSLAAPADDVRAAGMGNAPPDKPAPSGVYQGGGRTGGDVIGDATVIGSLPYSDSGNTCGYANDYDAACPYLSSTAPDVVYRYVPATDELVDINACVSAYDTKLYVFEDSEANLVACNDDAVECSQPYRSFISGAEFLAGHVYYILVDGYGAECGEYQIVVVPHVACELSCPPGALAEGEPPCQDGYVDEYNAGYGGFCWSRIEAQAAGCATFCGKSCTYLGEGSSLRDTDWFLATASGGGVTATCSAEFPLQFMLIYGLNCSNLQFIYAFAAACEPITLTWDFPPDQVFGLWVGPSVFSGVEESDYVFDVCGIKEGPLTGQGACCDGTACCLLTELVCGNWGWEWQGEGSACVPSPCDSPPPLTNACCLPGGGCQEIAQELCSAWGGTWMPGVPCIPDPCPATPVERTTWGRVKQNYR